MGGKITTYSAATNGKIHSVPLLASSREKHIVKPFAVQEIITEKISRGYLDNFWESSAMTAPIL